MSRHLEQAGGTLAAADAHGAYDIAGAAALALDQRVPDHAGARHAVGVADRDRAAVDVQPVVRDAQAVAAVQHLHGERSEEHTSELQSLMRISSAVFCLKKKTNTNNKQQT